MFADLPQDLQQKVRELLQKNDFRAARQTHDDWFRRVSTAHHRENREESLL